MSELESLYLEISELTLSECKKNCNRLGSCCEPMYCELAMLTAKDAGVTLEPTTNKLPMFDGEQCIAPPYFRKLCSAHNCDINAVGAFRYSNASTDRYFELRERIDILELTC